MSKQTKRCRANLLDASPRLGDTVLCLFLVGTTSLGFDGRSFLVLRVVLRSLGLRSLVFDGVDLLVRRAFSIMHG